MPTVKELREQAKSSGLRGYSTVWKPGLIRLIAEAHVPVFQERIERAWKTGRYPALTHGDVENPHKKAQRIRGLHQLQDEVTAALRARKYEQQIARQSELRLEPLRRLYHNLVVRPQKQRLVKAIRQEGPQILDEVGSLEGEKKGRWVVTWKFFTGLSSSFVDRTLTKVETTAFYLRFSFTYRLRNIEDGKVILFHKNLGGSPTLITNAGAAREWL